MKKTLLILLIFIGNTIAFGQTEKKVCFIGNSYTYTNDMPGMILNLAAADGNTLIKDQNTPGGYTFEGHSTNATSLSKISANDWDFVVLQEQSQLPSFPWWQVSDEVLPYAKILVDSIRSANPCAIPLFFNTWGRRDGDPMWDSINTFTKMNQRLHVAYDYMADKNSGMLSPVGIGFEHIANDLGSPITHTELYVGDGSHPSVYGTYLSACVFYEIIFETSSAGNTFIPVGISDLEATYIQGVANHVLNEVDSVTVDYTNPIADFTYERDGLTTTFTNTSLHAFEYNWNFGDGETSAEENPVHSYAVDGEYTVTLTAKYCGREDMASEMLGFVKITEVEIDKLTIYPNPSNGHFTIKSLGEKENLRIYAMDGQLLVDTFIETSTDFSFQSGLYLIRLGSLSQLLVVQ